MFSKFAVVAPVLLCAMASGAVTYQTQSRVVSVSTTFDNGTQSASAPDFNPFVQTVSLATPFPTSTGVAINRAVAGIDCHLDPNKIRVVGALAAAGGLSSVDGHENEEIGDAISIVNVSFHLDANSPFSLIASARPIGNPKDKFKIKLSGPSGGAIVFFFDEKSPAQDVNLTGVLLAGNYSLEFETELSAGNGDRSADYGLSLEIPAPSSIFPALGMGLLACRRRR